MISTLREAVRLALVAAAVLASSPAVAQQPFYKGKRLAVLVNFAPGGSTDIEGRLFARHIARHLEGEPNVVVQNMDGAGGFNGANYVGEIAPRDGTMLGFMGGTAWQFATDPERFRADLRSYEFIAFQPGTTVYYVRKDVAPGMKEPGDIVRATGPHRRRQRRAQRARPSDPAQPRHPRRAAPLRHRLSQRTDRAARPAAQRGQLLRRAGVGLSRRGRGAGHRARHRDPGLCRSDLQRRNLEQLAAGRRAADPGVPGSLPDGQGRAAVRAIVGRLSVGAGADLGDGPADRAAAAGAGSRRHGAAQRDRAGSTTIRRLPRTR